jgi:hypothetical protein
MCCCPPPSSCRMIVPGGGKGARMKAPETCNHCSIQLQQEPLIAKSAVGWEAVRAIHLAGRSLRLRVSGTSIPYPFLLPAQTIRQEEGTPKVHPERLQDRNDQEAYAREVTA